MDITKALCQLAKSEEIKFFLNNKKISPEEVFADIGLLPAIVKRADQLCMFCLGYGIGVTFVEAEKALLGSKVQFDEVTPNSLRLLYIYDVIQELIRESVTKEKVALDELLYD